MGEKTSLHKVDVSEKETKFEKFTNDVKKFFERTQLQNWVTLNKYFFNLAAFQENIDCKSVQSNYHKF